MEFAATVVILTCTYALLAAGVVILYKAARVVNFAHGELAIVGGYVFYSASVLGSDSLWLAIAGALVFSIIMGVTIYMSMLRRLVGEPLHVTILITIGIGIVLKSAILIIWRAERLTIDVGVAPALRLSGGASLSYMDLASVAVTVLFFLALYLFLTFTRMGIQFRGTAENALLASQRGVNVDFVLALAWIIAVIAASLSGVFFGSRAFLSTESVTIGLAGLIAALVGGLDSLRGAVAGAFIVAGTQYLTVRLIDPVLSETVPFLLLLLVMSIRPWGLFGTLEELDRV
ncbi:MAG: branched-chain amino acid ABC transporter permease [Xanthobacteraceae bacterium]|jgi:branched-chain amino acid transport system permease protein